ncbi:MAG: Gfo/Idh/MocA family oxidoreductase [Haliea sp.]
MTGHRITVGVIGLGGVGQLHLQAIASLGCVKLVSVCDRDQSVLEEVSTSFRAKPYASYQDLLQAGGIDLVLVLTPAATHREIVEESARQGENVLCEKPLATTLDDAVAMLETCRKEDVKFFYGSSYRYLPAIRKAYDLIRSGAIGNVQLLTEQLAGGNGLPGYRQLSPAHYPLGGPGGAGMGLMAHGLHLVDIFSWFVGEEIENVEGQGHISGADPIPEYMTMVFPCGAVGHLVYCAATFSTAVPNEGMFSNGQGWLADGSIGEAGHWQNEPGSISVYGDAGSLRIFQYTNALFLNDENGPRQISLEGRPAFGHFATQIEACVAALLHDQDPPVTGEAGLNALGAILAIYQSGPCTYPPR